MGRAQITGGLAVAAWLLVSTTARPARAWDDFGHMQVAAIAYAHLTPLAKKRAAALLRLNPSYPNWIASAKKADRDRVAFVRAATWADAIKNDRVHTDKDDEPGAPTGAQNLGYGDLLRHRYWHYVNRGFASDDAALPEPVAPNVQTQIALFRATLATHGGEDGVKSYDLSWLLHLVGDVHQPLHCVARFDKDTPAGDQGGNLVKIRGNSAPAICDDPRYCPYPPTDELHVFWDVVTGESYSVAEVDAAVKALPKSAARPAAAKAKDKGKAKGKGGDQGQILDEAVWVQEGFELAQTSVYVAPIGIGKGPFTVNAAYQSAALALARERIALGGLRLANLLNDSFAKEAVRR